MTPKHEFEQEVKRDVQARVREGVKAVLEEVLEEEMSEHLEAGYRELTPARRGLLFERYKRMSGDVEEAILERCTSQESRCARSPGSQTS